MWLVLEGDIGVAADFGATPENGVVAVVVVAGTIVWNATNALYELSGFFFSGALALLLVERRFRTVVVLEFDTGFIIPGNWVVAVVIAVVVPGTIV